MINSVLANKRVLLISIKFFNYESLIKKQLEEMGARVDLFDERPSNTFLSKAIIRLKKDLYRRKIHQYFNKIIKEIRNSQYDYFLLIKGEATPQFFIDFLKENNIGIKLIFYTYDSFKNNINGLEILSNFDYKFTFDSQDALNYQMRFRPLFYAKDYKNLQNIQDEFKNELAFIGTAHSDRYLISEQLNLWCYKNGLSMFAFYFSPSKLLFQYKKLCEKGFKNFDRTKISFKSLSHEEIVNIYRTSKVILDINHPGQNGLTMRTFETLGASRKLITTNSNVKKYPFYNPQNIYVIDRACVTVDIDFFKSDFKEIDSNLLKAMSLEGWVEEVFGLGKHDHWNNVVA